MAHPGATEGRASLVSRARVVHALPLIPLFMVGLLVSGTIRDNSFLWHIRAGSVQVGMGEVLSRDVFSFTELGTAWRTQSWLAELGYAQAESWFDSLVWVNWMVFGIAAATFVLIALAVYRSTQSPVSTGVILVIAVWLLGPFLQPRPVIISFMLLAALVLVFQHRDSVVWLVLPIMWLWAGVHGSWIIGGLLILLEWLRTMDRRLFWIGVASLGASLATPHGFGSWVIVADFFGAQEALAQMQEWKAPDFGSLPQMPYLLVIAGVIIAGIRSKITLRDLVVVLPFLFLGMTSRRTVVPAAIVLIPWAALAFPRIRVPRSGAKPLVAVATIVLMGLLALVPMTRGTVGALYDERFPSDAALAALDGTNPFYDDAVGGYLIYKQFPDRLVWLDDRAELHGAERLVAYADAVNGEYRELFDRYGFDAALTKHDWPLTDRLIADGWTTVHESDHFLVLKP